MTKELQIKENRISYQVTGQGKPVVLVHGFGEDGNIWKNQVVFLKDKFQFIIPDLPGSGQSAIGNGQWTMEKFAGILKEILDKENIDSSVMIGHSMGGYITLAFAEKYPERLSGFGLLHSSAYPDSEEKKATRRKGIDFINSNGAFAFLKTATPNLFSTQTRDEQPGLIDEMIAGLSNFSPAVLVNYYEAMMQRPDRTAVLSKAIVPLLFIMGKYDAAVPVEDSLQQSHLPENAYIHILRHSGHMGMFEEPGICNIALEKFLL